jgi:hypothetical protein
MSFYLSLILWVIIAAVLAVGIVLATKGHLIALAIGMVAFLGLFIRYGCLGSH